MRNLTAETVTSLRASPDNASAPEVRYVDFEAQYDDEKDDVRVIVDEVFRSGRFVNGPRIRDLEEALEKYLGVEHVVAVSNGTDALILAMKLLGIGPGDEVITVANSFVATVATVIQVGATPVLVDVREDLNISPAAVEAAITSRTKAILPVHLTGRPADMDALEAIAKRHGLAIVEDAAQAIGARYRDRPVGSFGEAAAFSCHPLKNLNAAGDAGFIVFKNAEHASRARRLRNHGLVNRNECLEWGLNFRMDVLQAALLRYRLDKLDTVIAKRRSNAKFYNERIKAPEVMLPKLAAHEHAVYHCFVIQTSKRDRLMKYLASAILGR